MTAITRYAITALAAASASGCTREPPAGDPRSRAWCERVIAPVAAPYVGSYALSIGPQGAYGQIGCNWVDDGATSDDVLLRGKHGVLVDVLCSPGLTEPATMHEAMANYESAHPQHLSAPGKAALRWPTQLKFWASNAECVVDIEWYVPAAGLDSFAAALDRRLTAATTTTTR